jgi:glycerate 2-kinase
LGKYELEKQVPDSITDTLLRAPSSALASTRKSFAGDGEVSENKSIQNIIIGDNKLAAQAALKQAHEEGFDTEILTNELQGEASEVGVMLAKKLRAEVSQRARPFCLIIGGETTVTIRGKGKGGRNQELALSAVGELGGLENSMLISLATDGDDGPTDAAGAVVTGDSAQRATMLGLDAAGSLSRNDAYPFFEALGDLLKPGPTGTNVNDLIFLIAT